MIFEEKAKGQTEPPALTRDEAARRLTPGALRVILKHVNDTGNDAFYTATVGLDLPDEDVPLFVANATASLLHDEIMALLYGPPVGDADEGRRGAVSDDWSDYETGPFCRHWGDPADCDIPCGECEHRCTQHGATDGLSGCLEADCSCEAWVEPGVCTCTASCLPPCKGQCGCKRCHDDYQDFLSVE